MLKTLKTLFKQDKEKFVVPKSVQAVIPIKTIWEDGIFLVGSNKYAKTFKFEDINYSVASREDKEAMFLEYSELLNSLDSGATTKITVNNRRLNKVDFEQTILIPMAEDGLDKYRKEYNKMLLDKATGANSIVQDKYVTVSVCKKNIEEARNYFARVGADLISHFARLGSKCVELEAEEKLRIFHDFYRTGEETAFRFDLKQTMRKGHDFKGRYLLEVNLRADGSSRFKDHWGYFPSASVGWRLSEEKFWDGIRDAVSNLKLRVSYGCLGNNSVGNYDWQTVYGIGNTSIGGNIVTSFTPGALVNAGLHWEETNVFDAGLDISFLKDFSLSLDYYNKFTHGILAREPISSVNGTGSGPLRNTAEVRNTGIEGFLSYNKRIRDWSIGVSINGAYNKNKVERYKNATLSSLYATYEGWPIGQFYLKEVDHIVQSQAEIDAMVADGFVFSDGKPGPGDFLYKNTYGDKRIDDKDKVFKGNPIPLFTYGANINAAWKGIDFNMILSGVAGYDRYIGNQFFSLRAETVGYLYPKSFLNMYTDEHPSTTHPRVYTAGNNKNQVDNDWHLHDASYLKIKTIQLGYTLPQRWTRKIRMERLRLYVNLENYFTFTSYPGLDPEVGSDITYPLTKTVSLGLNIKF